MRTVVLLTLAVVACSGSDGGRPDEELGGLVVAGDSKPKAIDVGKAAHDARELARALALPHEQVGEMLGPHALSGATKLEVREGDKLVEEMTEETAVELDAKGNYHARAASSKEYGREVFFVDGWMYLRPRYGKYHKRRPADEVEPARVRGEIAASTAATFELLARGASVSDGGELEVGGRKARKILIAMGKSQPSSEDEASTQRAWREEAVVQEVTGEVTLDAATGAPLRAQVRGAVAFQREGRSFVMKLEAQHELSSFGKVSAVAAPPDEETVSNIEPPHELDERESLLQGIAPPSRRAPTPGAATGSPK